MPHRSSSFLSLLLRTSVLVYCVAALFCSASACADRPNILLIVSDDQGWPDLGIIGTKPLKTPTLDRLAQHGVRATNFYAAWPACTPSRASLLTGRYPQRNGLYDMVRNDMVDYGHRYTATEYAVSPEMTLGLDVREVTLGNLLQSAGYRTGVVGKWDMGQAKRYLPLQRGFDFFFGHGNNGIDYYTHERYGVPSLFRNNERTEADRGKYATDLFCREALQFLDVKDQRPFFLYLCFNAPHGASSFSGDSGEDKTGVQAPEEFVKPYLEQGIKERLAKYYAAVECMDSAIGTVLQKLDAEHQRENTLILFMSDNGGSGNGGNAPLRGQKGTMFEGGLRVPFIANWPTRLPQGLVTDQFISFLDIFPTIAHITGAKCAANIPLDGHNILPVLEGQASTRTSMCWQRRDDRACRAGHWKWVESAKGNGLFDLSTDIGEQQDVSAQHPEKLEELRRIFAQWRAEMDAAEPRGPFRDY